MLWLLTNAKITRYNFMINNLNKIKLSTFNTRIKFNFNLFQCFNAVQCGRSGWQNTSNTHRQIAAAFFLLISSIFYRDQRFFLHFFFYSLQIDDVRFFSIEVLITIKLLFGWVPRHCAVWESGVEITINFQMPTNRSFLFCIILHLNRFN